MTTTARIARTNLVAGDTARTVKLNLDGTVSPVTDITITGNDGDIIDAVATNGRVLRISVNTGAVLRRRGQVSPRGEGIVVD